jgi:hypothetical protein
MSTLGGLLFLQFDEAEVERGDDVEEKDEKLDFWPVSLAESPQSEEVVVDLESKPGPFHLSGLALVLVEIFEGLGLVGSDVVELGPVVQNFLDVAGVMHLAGFRAGGASELAVFVGKAALVHSELVDVQLVSELLESQ